MAFGSGPHECGLAFPGFFAVDVGSGGDQGFDYGQVTGASGGHEDGFAFTLGGVRVGPGFEEEFDQRRVAVVGGKVEGGDAVAVRVFDAGSGSNEVLCRGEVSRFHGLPEVGGGGEGGQRTERRDYEAGHSSTTFPVLSANFSIWTPARFSSVRWRLASGVGSLYWMYCAPFT